ncbi:MAG: hypothetical protein M3O90_02760, partial [Actinomycetota bacterium]|nr:hypothetical protein [Actinomycetota bacterium]
MSEPLVTVGVARNQAEAEFMQGLLHEAGIPSMTRRSGGFDVPDFLASGPRDIVVAQSAEHAARDVLGTVGARAAAPPGTGISAPWVRSLAAALAVLVVALVAAGVMALV